MQYSFGPEDAKSYADMQRRREIAKQLTRSIGSPSNVGEGLNAIGTALMARAQQKKADAIRDQFAAQPGVSPKLMQSLYDLPQYRLGTGFHPGGAAIVGEDGPEIVQMPRGARVIPNPMTLAGSYPDADNATGRWQPDATGLVPDEMMQDFMGLPTPQQLRVREGIQGGGDPGQIMLRELEGRKDRFQMPPREESRFLDDQAYQVAQATLTDAINDPSRPTADEKMTEGQSKDVVYFRRGAAANQQLNELENALTQWTDSFAENFGALGRKFQDAEYQKARRAANEFLAMVLRKDTGAAVTEQEFDFYAPMYIPMPGDKPETIEAKRQAREQFLIGLYDASGPRTRDVQRNTAVEVTKPVSEMTDEEFVQWLQSQEAGQ